MNQKFSHKILGKIFNTSVTIKSSREAVGGSINRCEIITLSDGKELFVKTHVGPVIPGMYAAEFSALEILAAPDTLIVPQPLFFDENILVLEAFQAGTPASNWQEQMGRGLALLHQATRQDHFGFAVDNYLGTTLQINTWQDDWIAFWRDQRLGYQLDLFRAQTSSDDTLLIQGENLLVRINDILECDPESAVLLHGDLWSGNASANEKGEPVIFDPASYYGHREAEFGMMRLFGGFGPVCEAAYQEVWPFQPGSDRRIEVYRLYHQLNHLNLFGQSYYSGCLSTIKGLL